MRELRVACWNCSGIYSNYLYARDLLKNIDILALSEHWLLMINFVIMLPPHV